VHEHDSEADEEAREIVPHLSRERYASGRITAMACVHEQL
jgi:hypothetical protein